MTIRQLITGCLQKLNSRPSGSPSVMGINGKDIDMILAIQRDNPDFLLGGSAALILADILPYREMGDIDIITHEDAFVQSNLYMNARESNNYVGVESVDKQKYKSYYVEHKRYQNVTYINLLVYDRGIRLNRQSVDLGTGHKIVCQNLDDILYWKQQYNRDKDIKDLEIIMSKACEDAVFGG